jgi:hypothetical protein
MNACSEDPAWRPLSVIFEKWCILRDLTVGRHLLNSKVHPVYCLRPTNMAEDNNVAVLPMLQRWACQVSAVQF